MSTTELDNLEILHRRPIANQGFDPRSQPSFGIDHASVLRDIDGAATVLELISMWGRAGAPRALAALRDLHRWGACRLAEEQARAASPKPPTIVALTAAAPAARAEATPDEELDLAPATRERIAAAARMLAEGRMLDLLGVSAGTDRDTLKRAYYALSKEFHPDRYYGKRLGKYAAMLNQVFDGAAQAIRALLDQRTVAPQASPSGKQRRRTPRYAHAAAVRIRCETWPAALRLTTHQVGAGGLFVRTEQPAASGERAVLDMTLPNGSLLPLRARVIERVQARGQRPAGLCLQFDPLGESDRARFAALIEAARADAPAPAPASETASQVRMARGSGSVRTIAPIIGIDLGTSYISVSVAAGGRVHVLPWADGSRAMPSVVAFPRRGEVQVGAKARAYLARDPRHAIASAKRLLGRKADDPEIQGQLATAGYASMAGPRGDLLLDMWGEPFAIPQICGYLLDAARVTAERALGQSIGTAVLTAPVSFDLERQSLLKRAARLANLEIIDIIDEPSAAALANRSRPGFGGLIGVYDFGGGTFDFSVVDATGGDFRVLASAGDSWLGGDDFDVAVADAIANHYWKQTGVDLRNRAVEWQFLLMAAEKAKRDLSTADDAQLVVAEAFRTAKGTTDLRARIVRQQVEQLWRPLIDRSISTCLSTLALAGVQPRGLSAIYLSGGTSHIPAVREALQRYFGVAPSTGVPADFAVCLGAGIHAAQLEQLQRPTLAQA